eukprot:CAMPEP_0197438556 /NCGR_PEP_ID=MMETSP1175-20131217/5514_1 /TAXON_ID=1003142 /ORGANISM="Triceratium dubium, Strain CCMP147" /LENGTH=400 /DNA_ID=CAMNT_0042968307 /DNA_START=165 /DNA_END=1367 /DNA_ORIENTATION=+
MPSKAALAAAHAAKDKGSQNDAVLKKCGDHARRKVDELFQGTSIELESSRLIANTPKFNKKELRVGRVLGRGAFGVVREVSGITIEHVSTHKSDRTIRVRDSDEDIYSEDTEDKQYMSANYLRKEKNHKGEARYAVKQVCADAKTDPAKFIQALMDFSVETRFLSVLQHPGIINMRAISSGDPFDKDYFIVLDRLYDTLEKKIAKWRHTHKGLSGVRGKMLDPKGYKKRNLFHERLGVTYDLCDAIDYMHGKNIIYRDLKPENMGVDANDDIKLFDFGLAKELKSCDRLEDGTYKLTGHTGSMRYMAPEVHKSEPYNMSADIYSFSMLCWEILAMEKPFESYSTNMYVDLVVNKGYRPKCEPTWPEGITDMLKMSWSVKKEERPSAAIVAASIQHEQMCF